MSLPSAYRYIIIPGRMHACKHSKFVHSYITPSWQKEKWTRQLQSLHVMLTRATLFLKKGKKKHVLVHLCCVSGKSIWIANRQEMLTGKDHKWASTAVPTAPQQYKYWIFVCAHLPTTPGPQTQPPPPHTPIPALLTSSPQSPLPPPPPHPPLSLTHTPSQHYSY